MGSVIVNQGAGAWAFETLAHQLARALWIDVSDEAAERSYLLAWDPVVPPEGRLFVPWSGIEVAADKRRQAELFATAGVPTPKTLLLHDLDEAAAGGAFPPSDWVVKYPISCGASGHRFLDDPSPIVPDWPRPFVVQQFVELDPPEVFRIYAAGGELFGWNVRRFPPDRDPSPWVAHATGAVYTHLGEVPPEAAEVAAEALRVCGLLASFGCVDLLHGPTGWLALEVGTDGVVNHVDRDVGEPLRTELDRRVAEAFWADLGEPPWGSTWRYRS